MNTFYLRRCSSVYVIVQTNPFIPPLLAEEVIFSAASVCVPKLGNSIFVRYGVPPMEDTGIPGGIVGIKLMLEGLLGKEYWQGGHDVEGYVNAQAF